MTHSHIDIISSELDLKTSQARAVTTLLADGSTVPFIARYRKEATGSLDEVAITAIRDRLLQLQELDKRKESILKSLKEQGHLTDELKKNIQTTQTLAILEDLYLPYRPKRRTRATVARDKGLEPLARLIFKQNGSDPRKAAADFVDPPQDIESIEIALAGARDIIAELINEDQQARLELRKLFSSGAIISSRVAADKEIEGAKYRDYFDCQEAAVTAPSHRILAMRRGEKEDILNLSIVPPENMALEILEKMFVIGTGEDSIQVKLAVHDSYKRLLSRSLETEIRLVTKKKADGEAIAVFSENLRQLLLAPPLGAKRVMGIDPGFRTGCKIVCLNRQGIFEQHATIYPHASKNQRLEAARKLQNLVQGYQIEAIAVGNGTAGRETEAFVKNLSFDRDLDVVLVNESGASIYSASQAARQEFPDLDLTVRGAISIGRRLMDPLSELVKIDPKSIGVGQYQHDVDQSELKKSLDDVVSSCVNAVGVDVNRASAQLLTYVSGLGPQLANNIVAHREHNGPFASRGQLQKVPRLGPKAFEQSAGFLRIRDGQNPLDASAVHPESYHIALAMAEDLGCPVSDLMKNQDIRKKIAINRYVTAQVGIPTLNDILEELARPGRDPREAFERFAFASDIKDIKDLKPGMNVPGIVTNVTAFGAFIDVGVHQDGLVHISELSDEFVKNPADMVKVQQKVKVKVINVDLKRNRISLSMKAVPGKSTKKTMNAFPKIQPKVRGANTSAPFNNPFAHLHTDEVE
ncbi:MAG: RNA-binding transcriptional accessory protein [Desulfobacterales bacterium]|nr:RNA-binding transcriptional accessory protein [Desulfobacterales bacterium]